MLNKVACRAGILLCFVVFAGCAKKPSGATISGTVTLVGGSPADPVCACTDAGCHSKTESAEHWVVSDGNIANAILCITSGLGSESYRAPSDPVMLDQHGCEYHPHVLAMMLGQPLKILNSDATLHNVHLTSADAGEDFNKLFTQGMPPMTETFSTTGIKSIQCDVHQWMHCYVGVFSNPYFAVSDSTGHYAIRGLPAGSYTLELWHESSTGTVNPIVETRQITVGANGNDTANFAIVAR